MKKVLIYAILLVCLVSCGSRSGNAAGNAAPATRNFPFPDIPVMLTDQNERQEYLVSHFWDAFFTEGWRTDSSMVLGVRDAELERSLASYIVMLQNMPMDEAQASVAGLFSAIESRQAADTSSLVYLRMTEMVAKYLYDPNSPFRSEDLFLPFVEGLAASPFTDDARRPGYRFELEMCRLNPYGSTAPDFSFTDAGGRIMSLHGIKAEYTMLFFSNPGCSSCREIVDAIEAKAYTDEMIADGRLAVLNIYIDEDLAKWREYLSSYPAEWINAYDHAQRIVWEQLYYVRAIPSLYLLDSQKRIIFKDAPVERVLEFLGRLEDNVH